MELANKQSNTFAAMDQPSLTVMAEYRESDSTVRVNCEYWILYHSCPPWVCVRGYTVVSSLGVY